MSEPSKLSLPEMLAKVQAFGVQGDFSPTCVLCDDSGWESWKDDQGRPWARRCLCRRSTPIQVTNVPPEFAGALLDVFRRTSENAEVVDKARAWLPRGRDLFIWGPVGTGKTRLACALVQELHRPARFEVVDSLLRALVHDDGGELWHELVAMPVLILDDVGVTDSDWSRRALTNLYTERLNASRRTVFTSNHSLKSLVEAWDDARFGSRVAGAADVLFLTGPDMRRSRGRRAGE